MADYTPFVAFGDNLRAREWYDLDVRLLFIGVLEHMWFLGFWWGLGDEKGKASIIV